VPAPVEIAKAAYGERADGSLKKRVVRDVVSSILDGTRIRRQLVESAYHRVCNRAGKSDAEWNKLLGITCSMVRLFLSRGKGGSIEMALDTERDTRDYLFGRLLAAGEQIERVALEQEGNGVRRPTSAVKLFHRFADRPSSTWRSVDTGLAPYRVRLTGNPLVYRYERTIDEVMSLFDPEDFTSDRPLSAEFLLGYHCQRYEYFRPKQSQTDEQEDEDADS
jgi:CRISPR-associated protein Csd1